MQALQEYNLSLLIHNFERKISYYKGTKRSVYLAFGGNLGNVEKSITAAWELLNRPPIITVEACSRLYRTSPLGGPAGQDDYLNAACRVATTLTAYDLLKLCQEIEQRFGRVRAERWGPRTLDIDVLLYGEEQIDEPDLIVPHPRLRERLFALVPLHEVAGVEMKLPPDNATLSSLLHASLDRADETLDSWENRVVSNRSSKDLN